MDEDPSPGRGQIRYLCVVRGKGGLSAAPARPHNDATRLLRDHATQGDRALLTADDRSLLCESQFGDGLLADGS